MQPNGSRDDDPRRSQQSPRLMIAVPPPPEAARGEFCWSLHRASESTSLLVTKCASSPAQALVLGGSARVAGALDALLAARAGMLDPQVAQHGTLPAHAVLTRAAQPFY